MWCTGSCGTLGGKFVNWIQGQPFLLWEGSVCFTKPGDSSSEICMCSTDDCNQDFRSARKAAGISETARAAICDGKECPLANLRKINEEYDFNSACYTDGSGEEKCFTSDVVYYPQVGKLTRARRSVGDYELTNIDGENNSGSNIKCALSVLIGIVLAQLFR